MCTVTFIARKRGFALGMNRDEQLTRAIALPPARHWIEGRSALHPSERTGGTWIGVNDAGVCLALINWYSVTARVKANPISRGDVVKATLGSTSPIAVESVLRKIRLEKVNPFRLIGVFAQDKRIFEWRWNHRRLARIRHPWRTGVWISSGYDEPGAQRVRSRVFRAALKLRDAGSLAWLRRLHASHRPERGPCSVCMHREDAATVSYTEVVVNWREAQMRYHSGPLCSCASVARAVRCSVKLHAE